MKGYAVLLLLLSPLLFADIVVPKQSVTSFVKVRAANSSDSAKLGELHPGQSLPYASSVSRWHKVVLPGNVTGFVSKRWTDVEEDPAPHFEKTPFAVHFLDVGVGDAAIIDMGDKEIIIDGGNYINDLHNYIDQTGIIDGAVELVIVTHGDQDHWKGLSRLLGFDGTLDDPLLFEEYWDPGYNRDCNNANSGGKKNYLKFVEHVKTALPADRFKRPLEDFHTPLDQSGVIAPFPLLSIPDVKFTVLHSQSNPVSTSCSYMINNASIVLIIEIAGVKMIFTGDANGKKRDEQGNADPSHVEQSLLSAAQAVGGGVLKADLLKVPHHGSETASTESFIEAVSPNYVVISAATNHHLPRPTVLNRYENGQRIVLRTDLARPRINDHIICGNAGGELDCQYGADL